MSGTRWTILEQAHAALRTAVAGVPADAWNAATPCSEWTVAQVLQHAVGDQIAYAAHITGGPGPAEDPFVPSGTLTAAPEVMAEAAISAAAAAWATVDPTAAEVSVPMPPNVMTAEIGAGACALDAAVHAWDICVATGQPSPLGSDLARALLPVAEAVIIEPLRQYGSFAAALEAPADDDVATLLRYTGRNPNWSG